MLPARGAFINSRRDGTKEAGSVRLISEFREASVWYEYTHTHTPITIKEALQEGKAAKEQGGGSHRTLN